ncbi:MAG: hypothetical protein JNG88_09025 [Phycisphaerales bacterium]|nr:hypothetical protein [Phycisphaerales bacterium]
MAGTQPQLTWNDRDVLTSGSRGAGGGVRAWMDAQPVTLRNYYQTLFWTAAAIAFCAVLYALEKYVLIRALGWLPNDPAYRMFKNPAEAPMRLFGLPHIMIGTAFLLTSRRMRGVTSYLWLAGLGAIGIGFCWLFYRYGVEPDRFNPIALLLFYFYFLIHGFRDEAFFYKAYGDMPKEGQATHDRVMSVLQLLMLGLLVSLAIPAYVLFGDLFPEFRDPVLERIFPVQWPYFVRFASTFLPMCVIAAFALRRIAAQFPDGLAGMWRMHRPILTVFAISMCIILIALVSGPWTFNFVVLMHFVGWYLFGRRSLGMRETGQPVRGLWAWMRTTRVGFTVLHLGLAAAIVLIVAVSHYAFGKVGPVTVGAGEHRMGLIELLFGSKTFYYWTIMHVTLSFYPR